VPINPMHIVEFVVISVGKVSTMYMFYTKLVGVNSKV